MKKQHGIEKLLTIMARLRGPGGCPWDREQNHETLKWHAVEEVYELMEAIESKDDEELEEELGDLLLQVVFHCQLAKERGAFDFETVTRRIAEKLIRRHPHVFGNVKVKNVDQVWANWEKIKRSEKHGTARARGSSLDGIPRRLPALMRAEKLIKKARRAKLVQSTPPAKLTRNEIGRRLFMLVAGAQAKGWSAEDLLRSESRRQEWKWRTLERRQPKRPESSTLDKTAHSTKLRRD
jgi:XTP/dITP diphosphohydrolase